MHEVQLSPEFEITIPAELCERLNLKPGQILYAFERDGTIRLVRNRITELFGIAKGMKWKDDYRDRNDRF